MSEVDRLLTEYIEKQLAGERPEPRAFVEKLEGDERGELAELIDAYLMDAPADPWDPGALQNSPEAAVLESMGRALKGEAGMLPAVLPRLRARAKLRRDQVVAALAESLGLTGKTERVGAYYHQLEFGDLPARGVKDQVFDALGSILGVSGAGLRRAGEAPVPSSGDAGKGAAVYARVAEPDERFNAAAPGKATAGETRASGDWDEVDELFRGAGRG